MSYINCGKGVMGMNNIFSALIHRRTAGVIREFVLWCILCFEALLSLAAVITAGSKITWIMLLLFVAGLAVLTAFRLTEIALVYSVGVFHLITCIIHYICYGRGYSSTVVINLILFILLLLLTLALVVCSFIHLFSRYNLSKAVMVMTIIDSVFVMILQIMIYAAGRSGGGFFGMFLGTGVDFRGYWVGTICFWILLVVIDLYAVFAAFGMIETRRTTTVKKQQSLPQVQMQGICTIRYIPVSSGDGFYELYDQSVNGVYLENGTRLMKNSWNRLQRGSVICIGSMQNQFRLL